MQSKNGLRQGFFVVYLTVLWLMEVCVLYFGWTGGMHNLFFDAVIIVEAFVGMGGD